MTNSVQLQTIDQWLHSRRPQRFWRGSRFASRLTFALTVAAAVAYVEYRIGESKTTISEANAIIDLSWRGPAEIALIIVLGVGALAVLVALAWSISHWDQKAGTPRTRDRE